MAVFRIKAVSTWASPWNWCKNNITEPITTVRIHKTTGVEEIELDGSGDTPDITDSRAVRHLQNDPRFTQIS